jgi:hypothetical protein
LFSRGERLSGVGQRTGDQGGDLRSVGDAQAISKKHERILHRRYTENTEKN